MTNNIYWVLQAEIVDGQLDALKAIAPMFCEMTKNGPTAFRVVRDFGRLTEQLELERDYLRVESSRA